jgi:hypothetical protein
MKRMPRMKRRTFGIALFALFFALQAAGLPMMSAAHAASTQHRGVLPPPEEGQPMPGPDEPNPWEPFAALLLGLMLPGAGHFFIGDGAGGTFYALCCLLQWACWGGLLAVSGNPAILCAALVTHCLLAFSSGRNAARRAIWKQDMKRSYWVRAPGALSRP